MESVYTVRIKKAIEPLREQIINHPVYAAIQDVDDLKVFMQYHVFAVWDFMSLLKALQNNLTCTTVPWFPKGTAETRFLINEIVVGEESDVDAFGKRISHFELYLEAMQQCGAGTGQMELFLKELKKSGNLRTAFSEAKAPQEASEFVDFTFRIIGSQKEYLQAAIFTFGREDLIPGMFLSIIRDIHNDAPESISVSKYYLERHIEVDGDNHSHLALQMTTNLCGTDEKRWEEATAATIESLQKRIALWDGACRDIALGKQERIRRKENRIQI